MKLPESQRNSMYHCLNEQGNVIEHITEKYSHLLFFFLLVVMFLFLLLTELFAPKPAQRQPQSQEGHET